MKLSIIIVNFNVKYFLEACLQTVLIALDGIDSEVIVVDNASSDGSVEWISAKFPNIKIIANNVNVGFSKANNQAIRIAKGTYVLLLNPDTVVEATTFSDCIRFMEEHPDAGALGVSMIDGNGYFLPESKRGFPSPDAAFFKLSGLYRLFPKSAVINRYYLGHLSNKETNPIEVLAGAFMFIRKKVLDEIGLLDESFFMYGEDIDLSWRIVQANYKNYFLPAVRILHYKGESTKKASFNYVKMFYQAMIIFAQKHFKSANTNWFIGVLKMAIYLKAILAFCTSMLKRLAPFVVDALLIFGGLLLIKNFWEHNVKSAEHVHYPAFYTFLILPTYIAIWLVGVFFSGGYDKQFRWQRLIRGVLFGALVISVAYAFLPKTLQFSRALVVLGTAWSITVMTFWRFIASLFDKQLYQEEKENKRILIVGEQDEATRIVNLLAQFKVKQEVIGFVNPQSANSNANYIGAITQLAVLIKAFQINELIFCGKNVSASVILDQMTALKGQCNFKIVGKEGVSIVGSNSKDTAGDSYTIDLRYSLSNTSQIRNKRLFDLLMCLFFGIGVPYFMLRSKNSKMLYANWWSVLIGAKTWMGYSHFESVPSGNQLPSIKPSVFNLATAYQMEKEEDLKLKMDIYYAKSYSLSLDYFLLMNIVRI